MVYNSMGSADENAIGNAHFACWFCAFFRENLYERENALVLISHQNGEFWAMLISFLFSFSLLRVF